MPTTKKRSRKPKRGGARPGAGRPVTTGSGSERPVSFKLGAQRARAEAAATSRGVGLNELAKRALLDAIMAEPAVS